jgi:hypothetical protein
MNKTRLYKAGSIAFILLGIAHLSVSALRAPENPQLAQLLADMQNYKIEMFGSHNMLKFHNGFSLMMGFLLSSFGVQNLVLSEFIAINRKAQWTTAVITIIALVIAFIYFHILAYGFIFFSLICYSIPLLEKSDMMLRTSSRNLQ